MIMSPAPHTPPDEHHHERHPCTAHALDRATPSSPPSMRAPLECARPASALTGMRMHGAAALLSSYVLKKTQYARSLNVPILCEIISRAHLNKNTAMASADGDADVEHVVGMKRIRVEEVQISAKHRPASKQPGYKRPSNALIRLKTSAKTESTVRHLNRIDFCIFDLDRPVVIGRENAKNKPDIELKGDKTISREHCRVTAVRGDNDGVALHVAIFGKNGCIIDDQQIKSEPDQVTVVQAGPHKFQFGSIHFDVLVAAKTLKRVKPPADMKDKSSDERLPMSSRALARQRKEIGKKTEEDADQTRNREASALSAIASEYLDCRRNIGVVLALEEQCNDAAALFEEFKLFPMFPLPMHRRMIEVFSQVFM